ncbi:MAG: TonB family protein [Acidobacteriaceae bacterium]
MSTPAISRNLPDDPFRSGLLEAVVLHLLVVAAFLGLGYYVDYSRNHFGESSSSVGAIQATMVAALPLPQKFKPVENQVLAPQQASPAPLPPSKAEAAPPPRDTDIEIKRKTIPKKLAPVYTPAPPRHPQPTPLSPKAQTGESAMQLPEATVQTVNGTATVTVQSRTLGERYGWYIQIISQKVQQYYSQQFPDPRSSAGRSVTITFFVDTSGTPQRVRIQTPSGSPTLDNAGMRAVEEVDTFGPNPANQPIPIEFTFNYHR